MHMPAGQTDVCVPMQLVSGLMLTFTFCPLCFHFPFPISRHIVVLGLVIRNPEQHTGVLFNSDLSDPLTALTEGSFI